MTDPKVAQKLECDPIADDSELAHKAVEWAKSLTPDNDYLHNIHVIANNEWTDLKSTGFAASIISAYERAMGFERRKQARIDSRGQSNHVGEVGKRESWDVSLLFLSGYQTDWGYVKVVKFVDDSGNVFVWKSTSYTGLASDDIGKRFSVKGTVKAHNEYNGEKQTTLSRCKVVRYRPRS